MSLNREDVVNIIRNLRLETRQTSGCNGVVVELNLYNPEDNSIETLDTVTIYDVVNDH